MARYCVDSVGAMARKGGPTDEDYDNAARLALLGLIVDHHRNNMFPAEVLLQLAAEAIEESGTSPGELIQYEGMRDRHLPEYHFRGKSPAAQEPLRPHGSGHDQGRRLPQPSRRGLRMGHRRHAGVRLYALVHYGRVAAERTDDRSRTSQPH